MGRSHMFDNDELLQQKLEALKGGEPLELLLSDLDDTDEELEGLIRLASAIRSMPHPDLENKMRLEQAAMLAPELIRRTDLLANRNGKVKHPSHEKGLIDVIKGVLQQRKGRLAVPVLAGALILLFAFLASFGAGLWFASPQQIQFATLQGVQGVVEVTRDADGTSWNALSNGDRLQAGDRLRTQAGSSGYLVFFDGSRAELQANTQIDITRLHGGNDKLLQVVLNQTEGKTVHEIIPFENRKAMYVVYTPGGTASVHGTKFSVDVDQTGRSLIAVNHGKVLVSNDLSDVYLLSGQVTSSRSGQELDGPDFQFVLQGELEEVIGSNWNVVGVWFEVDENTQIIGVPEEGNRLLVEGRILQDDSWVADKITVVEEEEENGSFTGILEGNEGAEWLIGGWTVLVDEDTVLEGDLVLHSTVRAEFSVREGVWRAIKISLLLPAEDPGIPVPSPDPSASPSLSFQPDELAAQTCADTGPSIYEFGGTLINNAGDAKDYAAGVELSYHVIKGAEYVDLVELVPLSWDRIEAGESENFVIQLSINEQWRTAQDGSEIKVRVFVSEELNRPDHHPGRVTATLSSYCGDAPGDPPEPPPAPEPIVTPDPTQEVDNICVGADPHPTGMRLAERYDVTYEEIMSWFCQRFGFGEIELAYSLGRTYEVPVADVFAMKSSGMGWGDIRNQLRQNFPGDPTGTGPIITPDPNQERETACVGAEPHPTGMRLANRFGVSYEDIMGWFCQGYGFGEIYLAYELSRETSVDVENIFAMKSAGLGWGEIRKELLPGKPDKPEPPGNPNPPGPPDKPDKPEKPEPPDKPDKPEKPESPDKPDKPEKPESPDKPDKPETPGNPGRPT
jgi:hypothetical protein